MEPDNVNHEIDEIDTELESRSYHTRVSSLAVVVAAAAAAVSEGLQVAAQAPLQKSC